MAVGIAEEDRDENEQPPQTNSRIFISFQFVVCLFVCHGDFGVVICAIHRLLLLDKGGEV